MRILLTIPHFWGTQGGRYGSRCQSREARAQALTDCLTAVHRLFGGRQYTTSLAGPDCRPANEATSAHLDVVICANERDHVLDDLMVDKGAFSHQACRVDPRHLGFECHAVLREHLGAYDYYCYLEDDLILYDPWFFAKLALFTAEAGPRCLLQPNRFEWARDALAKKAYIDGDLPDDVTAPYQNIGERPQVVLPFMEAPILCRRTRNPHSGCFFLGAEQMRYWSEQPYFLDRDSRFYSPLESAATLGIMRTFLVYKPVRRVANFLEIEHFGDGWMKRIARRDAAAHSAVLSGSVGPIAVAATDAPAGAERRRGQPSVKSPERPLLVQSMVMAPGPNEVIRIQQPDEFLSRIPGVRTVSARRRADLAEARPEEERVFVWQRPILQYPDDLPKLRALLERDYLIVVEYDDDFARRPEHQANQFLTFRGCHCIQAPTPTLAEWLRELNPNVAVFENQISRLPEPRDYPDRDAVEVVFASFNRENDWPPIVPPLNELAARFGPRLHFTVIYDRRFFDAMETEHKTFEPVCPHDRYMAILQTCDVALLPLEPTRMNRAKSDLKFIESAACGVVALASPTVYEHCIEDGTTGVIYRTPEEFEEKLTRLMEDREHRRAIARHAYEYVRANRLLSQHVRERYDWYLEMRDALPRLNRQLVERVPELARSP